MARHGLLPTQGFSPDPPPTISVDTFAWCEYIAGVIGSCSQLDRGMIFGKPTARWGRKATGLGHQAEIAGLLDQRNQYLVLMVFSKQDVNGENHERYSDHPDPGRRPG